MKRQEEQQKKFKDIEVVITLMCNINMGVCLQSFENVLCHFEPTVYWLLSKYCNRKKLYFYWEPQERECVCVQ